MKLKDLFEFDTTTKSIRVDYYIEEEDVEPVSKGGPVTFVVTVTPVVDPERRGPNWVADYKAEIVDCECEKLGDMFNWQQYLLKYPRVDDNIKERAVEYARQGMMESYEPVEQADIELELNGNFIVPVHFEIDAEPEFNSMTNSYMDTGYEEIVLSAPVTVSGRTLPAGRLFPDSLVGQVSAINGKRLRRPLKSMADLGRAIRYSAMKD